MRKRLCAAVLAMVMTLGILTIPSGAADTTRFSDVSDRSTALAVETLRLMGVLDGYSDGTFRPNQQLTRAQFCKMAVYALGAENELGLYNTITVFPDVKPSHWAAGYINMAAKGKEIIAGYPDGRFYPDRTVTVGQAVTILLRLLGYKDDKIGGVWPDSYMAMASVAGLTEGMTVSGSAPLTRAQAARLFVNLLQADSAGEGGVEYTLSEETELLSVDGSTGQMKTTKETSLETLKEVLPLLEAQEDYSNDALYETLAAYVAEKGVKTGFVMWPIRTAVSGKQMTPAGATEIMEVLGKEESLERIRKGIALLEA